MKYVLIKNNEHCSMPYSIRKIELRPAKNNERQITEEEYIKWEARNYDYEVVKVADDIESLCDELIIVWKNGKPTMWHLEETPEFYIKAYYLNRKKMKDVYLGVWTNKGLIYVAKVNEDYEAELLWL